jgi:NAD(P)H-flavin reductase
MFRIIYRETLATKIHLFKIEAPTIARKAQPGQFVVVRVDEGRQCQHGVYGSRSDNLQAGVAESR